jgi:S-adenosylmethionine:tRNA ribosyltransferase-isomerase
LFLSQPAPGQWLVLMRSVGNARRGTVFSFDAEPGLRAAILAARGEGEYLLEIAGNASAVEVLGRVGRMPMPPYIKRAKTRDPQDDLDRRRYQTVYASAPGAVAAPTAGLHFTPELLAELASRQIHRVMVTLHVGMGTFKPIAVQTLADHPMHTETYSISEAAADALNLAKKEKRRIVGVGTTAARVLESQDADRPFEACSKETAIFIYPPYAWKHVGALVTNFHLPRSTLIALVAAMTGLTEQKRIYAEAIAERYRFFSYGDAMFID